MDLTPNRQPLEEKIGAKCEEFMFMGRVADINLFKHTLTRRYINLSDDGRCFVYRNRRYEPADFEVQIAFIEADSSMIRSQFSDGI